MSGKNFCIAGASALAVVLSGNASALDLAGGMGKWRADFSGVVGENGQTTSLENLGISGHQNTIAWLSLEHDIPYLPNLKLMHTNIAVSEKSQQTQAIVIGDLYIQGNIGVEVLTDMDLSHTDATLYYQLLDQFIEIDLGLSTRYFQGYVEIQSEVTNPYRWDLEGLIPMLYASTKINLGVTGFSLAAHANGISHDGNAISDYSLSLNYLLGPLGLELGYRNMQLDIENFNNFTADAQAQGAFAQFRFEF